MRLIFKHKNRKDLELMAACYLEVLIEDSKRNQKKRPIKKGEK